jgi:ribonuclease BN (tRNA processing enzyme)
MQPKKERPLKLELLFLGTGNAFAPGRAFSSFLVNRHILFEAGPTTLPSLRTLGVSLKEIRYILISHFHGDHCFGLPFIFLDHYIETERKDPLVLIGPEGLRQKAHEMMDLAFPGVRRRFARKFPVRFVEIHPTREYRFNDLRVRAYSMAHGHSYSLGFRLTLGGRHLAYCGDTGPCPALTELLRGAHIAVLEMTSVAENLPSHLNRRDILGIRKQLPQEVPIILTHLPALRRGQEKTLIENPYGRLEIAEDGKRFRFTL